MTPNKETTAPVNQNEKLYIVSEKELYNSYYLDFIRQSEVFGYNNTIDSITDKMNYVKSKSEEYTPTTQVNEVARLSAEECLKICSGFTDKQMSKDVGYYSKSAILSAMNLYATQSNNSNPERVEVEELDMESEALKLFPVLMLDGLSLENKIFQFDNNERDRINWMTGYKAALSSLQGKI